VLRKETGALSRVGGSEAEKVAQRNPETGDEAKLLAEGTGRKRNSTPCFKARSASHTGLVNCEDLIGNEKAVTVAMGSIRTALSYEPEHNN
jgi:hypothetical protein